MGLDGGLFVPPLKSRFKCGICSDVLDNPVAGCPEGHCFCHECIKAQKACPTCRAPYNMKRAVSKRFIKNRDLAEIIQELEVYCRHHECAASEPVEPQPKKSRTEAGASEEPVFCSWQGPLSQLEDHLNSDCLFQPVPCPHSGHGCKDAIARFALERHEKECSFRPLPCPGCHQEVPAHQLPAHIEACLLVAVSCQLCGHECLRQDLQTHIDTDCPEADVPCVFSDDGCIAKMKRKGVAEHKAKCDFRPLPCSGCKQDHPAIRLPAHEQECPMVAVTCECGHEGMRQDLHQHKAEQCPEAQVECEFSAVGCMAVVTRKDAARHANEAGASHASLTLKALGEQKKEMDSVKAEMAAQREEMLKMKDELLAKIEENKKQRGEYQGECPEHKKQRQKVRKELGRWKEQAHENPRARSSAAKRSLLTE